MSGKSPQSRRTVWLRRFSRIALWSFGIAVALVVNDSFAVRHAMKMGDGTHQPSTIRNMISFVIDKSRGWGEAEQITKANVARPGVDLIATAAERYFFDNEQHAKDIQALVDRGYLSSMPKPKDMPTAQHSFEISTKQRNPTDPYPTQYVDNSHRSSKRFWFWWDRTINNIN